MLIIPLFRFFAAASSNSYKPILLQAKIMKEMQNVFYLSIKLWVAHFILFLG